VSDDERTPSKKKSRTLAADSGSYALTGAPLKPPETAHAVAIAGEPRWPRDSVLAWIAFRRIEALPLSYQELERRLMPDMRLRRGHDAEPPEMPLVSKEPVRELLSALKAWKLEAIGPEPDYKPLPDVFWDKRSLDPRTWPEVRFRREDVLRLWPPVETLAAEGSAREGAPLEAKAGEEVGAPSTSELTKNERKRLAVDATIRELGVDAFTDMPGKARQEAIKRCTGPTLGKLNVSDRYVSLRLAAAKAERKERS
jgi:hypothetical protein